MSFHENSDDIFSFYKVNDQTAIYFKLGQDFENLLSFNFL